MRAAFCLFGEEISRMPEEQLFPCARAPGWSSRRAPSSIRSASADNVAYQLIQERVPDDEIDRRVREALRFVELEETFDLFPGSSPAA